MDMHNLPNTFATLLHPFFFLLLFAACNTAPTPPVHETFFVGGYTSPAFDAKGKGIYTCRLDTRTGEMKLLHTFHKSIDPSYLTVHPNGKYLYTANETGGKTPGFVSAYKILEDGRLKFINERYTGGDYPCHVSLSSDDKYLLIANYGGGSVATIPLLPNGGLDRRAVTVKHSGKGTFEERQEAPHAHFFGPGINDSSAFAVDLGIDKIIHYRIRKNGHLGIKSATSVTKGTGPRHLVFHPVLKSCYVILEFTNEIEVFRCPTENKPFVKFQSISTMQKKLPFYSATSSAIKIHPSGRFLYAANRGIPGAEEDNIAVFSIHPQSGRLTFTGTFDTKGKVPRDFEIDPSGRFLLAANQATGNLVSFKIDQQTGMPSPTGFNLSAGTPTCIKFQ